MTLKGCISSIFFILCVLCAAAQESLHFDRASWDFGTIREADGPVSHTFTGRNVSGNPVVIVEANVSCGCLKPEYSRKPVLPGQEVLLRVTYDPANRPGRFDKQIGVFVSGSKIPVKLGITGTVEPREKTVSELYPLEVGGGVRLETNFFAFSYLYQDEAAFTSVGVTNTSERTVSLGLSPRRQSGFLTVDAPAKLAPGERAEIGLRYLVPQRSGFYGTVQDELALSVDGAVSRLPFSTHGISVDSREIVYDDGDPSSRIDPSTLRFGEVKRGSVSVPQRFSLRNEGRSPLVVRAVEAEGPLRCSLRAGDRIPAGGSLDAEVTLDTSRPRYGAVADHITLITNDPVRPLRKVRVTAVFTD